MNNLEDKLIAMGYSSSDIKELSEEDMKCIIRDWGKNEYMFNN